MTTPVILPATAKHTATLIFFHGLGDTGHGWASSLRAIQAPHVKIICPTARILRRATPQYGAPQRNNATADAHRMFDYATSLAGATIVARSSERPDMPVTLNAGFRMPSWFDLRSLDSNTPEDEDGIRKAASMVHSLLGKEIDGGIPSNRIAVGGFSQGGALAIFSALTFVQPLAGIIGLSCWLPLHRTFPAEAVGNKETPLLQCHGNCDPVLPYKWGQLSASILKQFMPHTEFKTYNGLMHTSCDEEMLDVQKFLDKCLKP